MRDVARRTAPLTRRRLATGALAATMVGSLLLGAPPESSAARPKGQSPAEFLASRNGGAPSDYELVYERSASLPDGDVSMTIRPSLNERE